MHNAQSMHVLQSEQQLPRKCLNGVPAQGWSVILEP